VKYSNNIKEKELRAIRSFVDRNDVEMGIVATRDLLERRDNLLLIPAFIIMLMEDPLRDLKHIFHEMDLK
jgi:hypothetical protein